MFSLLTLLSGCNTIVSPSINGQWELVEDGETKAVLVLGPGDIFHVDLPAEKGIEVEGRLRIAGREITFINEKGTDAIASDPAPGQYMYQMDGDTLLFAKISDPLQRRSRFLSKPWTKKSSQ